MYIQVTVYFRKMTTSSIRQLSTGLARSIASSQKILSYQHCLVYKHLRTINACLPKYGMRNMSSAGGQCDDSSTPHHNARTVSFTPVYRFKYIVHLKVLARLKIYQTALTVIAVPPTYYYHSIDAISKQLFVSSLGIASLACTMLFVISFTIRKVVGMLSLSKDGKTVKISHLSFWGKRKDIFCDVTDIVPLADMSESPTDIFVRLKRYSTKLEMLFFLRHGQISDVSKLRDIIGSVK